MGTGVEGGDPKRLQVKNSPDALSHNHDEGSRAGGGGKGKIAKVPARKEEKWIPLQAVQGERDLCAHEAEIPLQTVRRECPLRTR